MPRSRSWPLLLATVACALLAPYGAAADGGDDAGLDADPATADLTPRWRPVSYWFGELRSRAHAFARREPGGFGMSLSSPNSVATSAMRFTIRDEVDDRYGLRQSVVENLGWEATLGDLYYEDKGGGHIGAGSGGSGARALDEADLAGAPVLPNPRAVAAARARVREAQEARRRALASERQAEQEVATYGEDPDAPQGAESTAPAEDDPGVPASPAEIERRRKASEREANAWRARGMALQKQGEALRDRYVPRIQALAKLVQAADTPAADRATARDELMRLSKEYAGESEKLGKLSRAMTASGHRAEARKEVARMRGALVRAWRDLASIANGRSRGATAETPTMPAAAGTGSPASGGAGAPPQPSGGGPGSPSEGAAPSASDAPEDGPADAQAGAGDGPGPGAEGREFGFQVLDKKLLEFQVQRIPLRLDGFRTVLAEGETHTAHVEGGGIDARLSARTTREADRVTVRFSASGGGGSPGLIGGGEWQRDGHATRYDVRETIEVKGRLLCRIRVPNDAKDLNVLMPDEAPDDPNDPAGALAKAIPVPGEVKVEAWLLDPTAPAASPPPPPLVSTHSDAKDGTFDLVLPKTKGETLRLEFTYANAQAQLREVERIEVSTDAILAANAAATGGVGAASVQGMARMRTVYVRFGGSEMEMPLDGDGRGANVRHDGGRATLEFKGWNSVFINTFIRETPYLNQNLNAFTLHDVAVPPADRFLASRPAFVSEAAVLAHLGASAAGASGAPGTTTVGVRGSVICFPTCVTMALGGLDLLDLQAADGRSDQVRLLCQGIYEFHAGETRGAHPPQPPWVYPFPDDPSAANRAMAGSLRDVLTGLRSSPGLFGRAARTAAAVAGQFAAWPFQAADAADLDKQWLVSEAGGPMTRWWDTTTGDELEPVRRAALRPWQNPEIVRRYLRATYPGRIQVSDVAWQNVFSGGSGAAVNALGRGGVCIVSIRHLDSTGREGGHLLVLVGAVVRDGGTPVRLIFQDPYGDQTLHPGVEGYYGPRRSDYDKDPSGTKGRYAPYGREINSFAGSLAGKYYLVLEKAGAPPTPEGVRERLLPSAAK